MVRASTPSRSTRSRAARSTRSRDRGVRRPMATPSHGPPRPGHRSPSPPVSSRPGLAGAEGRGGAGPDRLARDLTDHEGECDGVGSAVTGRGDRGLLRRGPHVPAPCRLRGPGARHRRRDLRRGRGRLAGVLGPPGRRPRHLVRRVAHHPRLAAPVRQVVRRRHAQRLRTTASTATSRPARGRRSPTTGRASRATSAPSPTPTCWPRSSASPTCSRAWASARATGSPSTCR